MEISFKILGRNIRIGRDFKKYKGLDVVFGSMVFATMFVLSIPLMIAGFRWHRTVGKINHG
jgi:hypothetical protein